MLNHAMTEQYITDVGRRHFERRREKLAGIASAQAATGRQAEVRKIVAEILGPFRERTPLNIKSIETLEREGYSVELLTYQSLPGVITTANLYRPADRGPGVPGVICIPGHWLEGKANAEYQRLGQVLARRGIAALIYDNVGHGERLEFYDSTLRRSWLGKNVQAEHTHLGNLLFLTGQHLGNWMLWDAMRGMDLLVEHAEVDARRMGVTGVAAGGALTRLLACVEPRVAAAATVADYYELESLGGEDPEQNLFGSVARGVSASDLLMTFAPKPLLVASCSADRAVDKFRASLAELTRWYELLGAKDKLASMEADGPHGYLREIRALAVEHFAHAFGLGEERVREPATPPESAETLYCTETGQVSNSLNSTTMFTFHKNTAADLPPALPVPRDKAAAKALQDEVRARFVPHLRLPEPSAAITSEVESHSNDWGFMAEKGRLVVDQGMYVPYSFYALPASSENGGDGQNGQNAQRASAPTVLALHDRGVAAISSHGAWMAGFAAAGMHVMAIDVCGTGETRLQPKGDESEAYEALLCGAESKWARRALGVGLSLFGMRVFNVLRTLNYLRTRWDVDKSRISIVGVGRGALWGMYAAALDGEVSRLAMLRSLGTYKCLVERRRHNHHFSIYLPGCLKEFDLPHVAACVAPRPLTLINTVDGRKERRNVEDVQRDFAIATSLYKTFGAAGNFSIVNADSSPETVKAVTTAIGG